MVTLHYYITFLSFPCWRTSVCVSECDVPINDMVIVLLVGELYVC